MAAKKFFGRLGNESGSVTILALALMAAIVTIGSLMLSAGNLAIQSMRTKHAADQAAVSAADALRGLNSGQPCATAESVAHLNMVSLDECRIVRTDVLVRVHSQQRSIVLRAEARAGPPN